MGRGNKNKLSYVKKKERFMDIHQSIYKSESKSNNCKRQGHSKLSIQKAKRKNKRRGKFSSITCCFSNKSDDEVELECHKEDYSMETYPEECKMKTREVSLSLSDYVDKLMNQPA